jgi:cystathionine gamma-synthase
VDTVLAQGGFVGHRSFGPGDSNSAFLGDATGSIIPPIFPSTTYARDGSRGGYDLRHYSVPPKDVIVDDIFGDDDTRAARSSRKKGDSSGNASGNHHAKGHPNRPHPDDKETEKGLMYSRPDNPTYTQTESLLASLEEGQDAALFSSGMAAVAAVATATLRAGDRAAIPKNCYFAVRVFFEEWCEQFGVECALYDCEKPGDLERAVLHGEASETKKSGEKNHVENFGDGKCKLLWIETPSNPTWRVTDVIAAVTVAKKCGTTVCCDATVLTPLVCKPLKLGADLVMHSATKYLNGHSDVVAGAVVGRKTFLSENRDPSETRQAEVWRRLLRARSFGGSVLGPFEAWLLLRGARTLHVRVTRQCESAMFLARKLVSHARVSAVFYPGLDSHPGHVVAAEQQSSKPSEGNERLFGGMLSIRCAGGKEAALLTTSLTKVWFPATSLGGVESLMEHRKSVEGPSSETPDDLLRLSVGLENKHDLWMDLSKALEEAHARTSGPELRD